MTVRSHYPWKGVAASAVGVAAGGFLTWVFRADGSYLVGAPLGVLGGAAAALIAYLPLALFFGHAPENPAPESPPG